MQQGVADFQLPPDEQVGGDPLIERLNDVLQPIENVQQDGEAVEIQITTVSYIIIISRKLNYCYLLLPLIQSYSLRLFKII